MPASDLPQLPDAGSSSADDELALERWLHKVLMEAMNQKSEQRRAYIEAACQGSDEFLDTLISRLAEAESFEHDCSVSLGEPLRTHIGVYRMEKILGRGGMGVVHLATREDDFTMQVAIKLVRAGEDAERSVRAFHRERQILASLQHPYITQIYDGGTTDDGSPYLVMEYVEGRPLTQYLEAKSPNLHECLELFVEICEAVSFAHENMVIHRDLKPTNVLVTDEGHPKLLDFGIASVLEQEHTIPAVTAQEQDGRLTPEYACPEQVRGERLTAAADVYALGVILYEMLTGCLPHRFKTTSLLEWRDKICNEVPLKPGVALRLRHKHREKEQWGRLPTWRKVPRDLDAIVAKAIAKNPRDRYGSADALARDIQRHLHHRPVQARRARPGYLFRRWLSRKRIPAAVFLLLLGFGVTALHQRNLAIQERDVAELQRHSAQLASQFMRTMLVEADPKHHSGEPMTVLEMLDHAVIRLDQDHDATPLMRARLYSDMGTVYLKFGDRERAETLFRRGLNFRKALDMPPDALLVQLQLQLARAMGAAQHLEDRLVLLRQAKRDGAALPSGFRTVRLETELLLSETYFMLGWLSQAEVSAQQVVLAVEGETESDLLRGAAYCLLAKVSRKMDDHVAYEAFLEHALENYCRIEAQNPIAYHTLSVSYAQLLAGKGDLSAAEARFQRAFDFFEARGLRDDGVNRLPMLDGLVGVMLEQERGPTAANWLERKEVMISTECASWESADQPSLWVHRAEVALLYGRDQEAMEWFERVQQVEGDTFCHPALVDTYLALGRLDDAREVAFRALAQLSVSSFDESEKGVQYLRLLACIENEAGRFHEALAYQEQAKEVMSLLGMWELGWGGYLRVEKAGTLLALGRDTQAARLLKEAQPIIERHFHAGHSVHVLHKIHWARQMARRGVLRGVSPGEEREDRPWSHKALRLLEQGRESGGPLLQVPGNPG